MGDVRAVVGANVRPSASLAAVKVDAGEAERPETNGEAGSGKGCKGRDREVARVDVERCGRTRQSYGNLVLILYHFHRIVPWIHLLHFALDSRWANEEGQAVEPFWAHLQQKTSTGVRGPPRYTHN